MAAVAARRGARGLWFRNDLRVDDNLVLQAASDKASSLLPVFVFDPAKFNVETIYGGAVKSSARRARFLMESVACLRKRLEAAGSGLAVVVGAPHEALSRPALLAGCEAVCVQQSVCSEEQIDEEKVAKRLKGCDLKKIWGGTLYMPNEIGGSPDDTPLMFTQFKNKAEGRGRIQNPVDAPKKLPPLPELADAELQKELAEALKFMPTLEKLGYSTPEAQEAMQDDERAVLAFEGGEDAARQRVQKWMFDDDKLKDYFEIRNGMLGDAYSSKLSPWLALGCISPRRIWKDAQRYEAQRVKNKSTYWLIFELTWRDFFIYMARTQGDKIFVQGGVTGDTTPWKGSDASLQKWKDGKTGDPLVDANMLELKATGFMSNRGRQNVASFLIFNLSVNWRWGAAHFEEYLLDYDPCSNWGNWVAATGLTGQRINQFNTKKQLNDYDPQRLYVKHWLDGQVASGPRVVESGAGKSDGKGKDKSKGKGKGSGRDKDVVMADAEEQDKLKARMDRFGTGDSARGGGYSGKGGRGGGRGGGGGAEADPKKVRRWAAKEKITDQLEGA